MRGQSRRMSLFETICGTVIGFVVAMATQAAVFPIFDIHTEVHENFLIAAVFTVVSLIRGYLVRRLFNWIHSRRAGGLV